MAGPGGLCPAQVLRRGYSITRTQTGQPCTKPRIQKYAFLTEFDRWSVSTESVIRMSPETLGDTKISYTLRKKKCQKFSSSLKIFDFSESNYVITTGNYFCYGGIGTARHDNGPAGRRNVAWMSSGGGLDGIEVRHPAKTGQTPKYQNHHS